MIHQRIVLVVLLCLAWILPGLIGHDPWKPEEGYSFGVVHEILQGGSWIVPYLAGEPFVEKPSLFYLSAAASAWLFSPLLSLHDGARMATGFYMALTFLFTGLASRELYGKNQGAVSALLLLGCFGLTVRAHQLIPDVMLLAGFAIAFYGLALGLRRPALGGFWLGTGAGVGFMAKGLITPGALVIVALALPLLFQSWRTRSYGLSLAVAAVAALPWLLIWPLALYQTAPLLFDEWLWVNNLGRFNSLHTPGPLAATLHYVRILPWYGFPALPIALWVLWDVRSAGSARPGIQLPLLGFIVILAVLSVAAELYALPLLVPLVLLATPAINTLRRGAGNAWIWLSAMGFTFFIIVGWFYWVALELGIPERLHHHLHTLQPGYTPGFKLLPFALGVVYTLAWITILVGPRRNPQRPVFIWAAGVTVVWGLIAILFIGWVDTGKSYRSMIAGMQQAMPQQYRCVSSSNLGEPQRAMLHYYADIITHREEVPERARDCDLQLVQGVPQEENVPLGPWRKIWEGSRPGDDKGERFRLYQRTAEKPKRS